MDEPPLQFILPAIQFLTTCSLAPGTALKYYKLEVQVTQLYVTATKFRQAKLLWTWPEWESLSSGWEWGMRWIYFKVVLQPPLWLRLDEKAQHGVLYIVWPCCGATDLRDITEINQTFMSRTPKQHGVVIRPVCFRWRIYSRIGSWEEKQEKWWRDGMWRLLTFSSI